MSFMLIYEVIALFFQRNLLRPSVAQIFNVKGARTKGVGMNKYNIFIFFVFGFCLNILS